MVETFPSEIVGTAGLMLVAIAAGFLAWVRRPRPADEDIRRRTALIFSVGLLLQTAHVVEEYSTGFHQLFPQVMGLSPWSAGFFLIFNLSWLAIWTLAAFGLRAGFGPAFFPVWFFSLAAMANATAHPLLAIRAGAYFPGLLTAPLVGVAGGWLCVRLVAITEPRQRGIAWRPIGLLFEMILFSVVVPGAVTYWIPRYLLGLWAGFPQVWTAWQMLAALLLTMGLAVYVWCLCEFAVRGRGIPAPLDHPKELVVTGLYRYVRNPMYVGVLLILIGESLFFESWTFLLYTFAWLAVVHLNVVLYEEPNLHRKFGEAYDNYRSAVRRWIPGKGYGDAS